MMPMGGMMPPGPGIPPLMPGMPPGEKCYTIAFVYNVSAFLFKFLILLHVEVW